MSLITITTIGTCRINSAMRRGIGRYPYALNAKRNYGFVHSTAEILQLLEFLRGNADIPEDVYGMICRTEGGDADSEHTVNARSKETHIPSDIYLIEISSLKDTRVAGTPVQSNYLYRYFAPFFDDSDRTRTFWSMTLHETVEARRAWLETDAVYESMDEPLKKQLNQVSLTLQSDQDIERGMEKIVAMLGKEKVVFVTHVNAFMPNGKTLRSRERLISTVYNHAHRMGVPCYDPTRLMQEFGQEKAMEKQGRDLTHYTPDFADRLCDDWFQTLIMPRLQETRGKDDPSFAIYADIMRINHLIDAGDIIAASQEIYALHRAHPERYEYQRIIGNIQFTLGNYAGAIRALQSAKDQLGASESDDIMLMQAHTQSGDFAAALQLGEQLLANELEQAAILHDCAVSAAALGQRKKSLSYWERTYHSGNPEMAQAAAGALLTMLIEDNKPEKALQWAEQSLQEGSGHYTTLKMLWQHALSSCNDATLDEVLRHVSDLSAKQSIELAEMAQKADNALYTAKLLRQINMLSSDDAHARGWSESFFTQYLQEGSAALEQGDAINALNALYACYIINPEARALKKPYNALRKHLRDTVRAAYKEANYAYVVTIAQAMENNAYIIPEISNVIGRAAVNVENYALAVRFLSHEVAQDDAAPLAWLQLARAAIKIEDFGIAVQAYHHVLTHEGYNDSQITEAERKLPSVTRQAIKQIRALGEAKAFQDAQQLLALLNAHPITQSEQEKSTLEREAKKLISALKYALKEVGAEEYDERFRLSNIMLAINPNEPQALKIAAVSAMRLHKYEIAHSLWQRILPYAPDPSQIETHIAKCALHIARNAEAQAAIDEQATASNLAETATA